MTAMDPSTATRRSTSVGSAADWWAGPAAIANAAAHAAATARSERYRLGDATLGLATDDPTLAAAVRELYADCAESADAGLPRHCVKVTVHSVPALGCHCIEVGCADPVPLLQIAQSLLEPRPGDAVIESSTADGCWRLLARIDQPARPLVGVAGHRCVLATAGLPPFFLRDLVVATALAVQHSVLFLHAASVAMGGTGVLLCGRSGAGKTTLAMTLAARGHTLLGDDFAALRKEPVELLPLRRTLHVRSGLRAHAVDAMIKGRALQQQALPGGHRRAMAPPSALFAERPQPAPLRAAFFLRGFRRDAAIEPFTASLTSMQPLQSLPIRHQWGIRPGGRFMRFALLVRLLAKVPCHFLDVGRPEATAELVESTLRAS